MTRALMTAATMYNDQRFLSKSELRIYKNKLRRKKIVRRQRILLFLAAALLIFGIVFLSMTLSSSATGENNILYKYYKPVSVQAGESLWSIASDNISYEKYDDMEAYITEVRNINHLEEDEGILAGEEIVVPYYSKEYK